MPANRFFACEGWDRRIGQVPDAAPEFAEFSAMSEVVECDAPVSEQASKQALQVHGQRDRPSFLVAITDRRLMRSDSRTATYE